MLAVLQRSKPVVVTYHGTDVNSNKNFLISLIASRLSSYNILTSDSFIVKMRLKRKFSVIPCGIDLDRFKILRKPEARKQLNLRTDQKIILFSSRFDNKVKNYPLARKASDFLKQEIPAVELLELKGYSRDEMNLLLNAADVLLVTSFSESGPLVVKEAMACNLPVVSTNVGDVEGLLRGTPGSYITSYDPDDVTNKLRTVIMSGRRLDTRAKVSGFENRKVALRIRRVYETVAQEY
jgi:teichuronic acid biosynthesis glycosyltransferase TuaC